MAASKKIPAALRLQKPASKPEDWAVVPPRPTGSLMARLLKPRVDTWHSERAPTGQVVEFAGRYAQGHHITSWMNHDGPQGWFDHDRIDPGARRAKSGQHHAKVGCLTLDYTHGKVEREEQSLTIAQPGDIAAIERSFGLDPLTETQLTDKASAYQFGNRIDLTMPAFARAILVAGGLGGDFGDILPPMSIVRDRRRRVETRDHHVSAYVARDVCYVRVGHQPATSDAADPEPAEPTLEPLGDRQTPHAYFSSIVAADQDAMHLPVYMRLKTLADNRLVNRFYGREALRPDIEVDPAAKVGGAIRS